MSKRVIILVAATLAVLLVLSVGASFALAQDNQTSTPTTGYESSLDATEGSGFAHSFCGGQCQGCSGNCGNCERHQAPVD